jgi:outer membrane receptor protein involved in Fe transport
MPPAVKHLLILCALSVPVLAQISVTGGTLEGAVADASGGRVPNATVNVRDVAAGRQREVNGDAQGSFRLSELPAGTYEVNVSQPGFAPYRHSGVAVALGTTVHLDVMLQSASVTTQLTVSAQPSPIDPAQTSVSSSVDTERIEELPVESRNYLNFVLLAPGVSPSAEHAGSLGNGASPDSGFSFGGLRARSNNVAIDGLDNNDEFTGSSRTELSLETVQEFQVVNAGLSAESGGASGGSINVITRNGANEIHGDAFAFIENGALGARNPFETERAAPDLQRYRIGVALGGPIVRNRTFYYAAFEQEHSGSLEDTFIPDSVAESVNNILRGPMFSGLTTRALNENRFPAARAETEASIKLNHQFSDRNSFMLRYAFTNNREAGDAFNNGGLTDLSARGSSFTKDNDVVGALTTILSPQSISDLRFQYADRRAVTRTNDATGPGIDIAGLVSFGQPYAGNGRRTETHNQVSWTYSHALGNHLVKAGVTVNRVHLDAAVADGFGGLYIFANLADFAAGQPDQFRQAFGLAGTNFSVVNTGGFVQDHWRLTPKLTVDLGVRYDFEHLPNRLRQDPNNISPRFGLAYQISPKWIVRAGYGIFYDRYVLASLNPLFQKNGMQAFEQVVDGATAASLFQSNNGAGLVAPIPTIAPSIYRADPNLATPYSQQTTAAVQHQIGRDITATASYVFVRGVKLSRTTNTNLLPAGPEFGNGRANPSFDNIFELQDSANSRYQGLSLTVNRRMSNELEFSGSYTFSKSLDDASDFTEQPMNPFNFRPEWAHSLQDQRHRLVFNGLWELPIGDEDDPGQAGHDNWITSVFGHLEVAPIVTLESGRPVNPLTGIDSNLSDAFPLVARPLGFGRNSLNTPLPANIDFRLLKYFPFGKTRRLDVVAEAFNLLNHTNVSQINPIYGVGPTAQPGFMQPITGAGPRRIQFSIDFEF